MRWHRHVHKIELLVRYCKCQRNSSYLLMRWVNEAGRNPNVAVEQRGHALWMLCARCWRTSKDLSFSSPAYTNQCSLLKEDQQGFELLFNCIYRYSKGGKTFIDALLPQLNSKSVNGGPSMPFVLEVPMFTVSGLRVRFLKHRTGCLVGCLRKWQDWCLSYVVEEYKHLAGTKWRETNLRYLESYDVSCIKHCLEIIIYRYCGSRTRRLLSGEKNMQKP